MQYMLFITTSPDAPEYNAAEDNIEEWIADVEARKIHVIGDRLRPVSDATTVRVRDGETLLTDGPFAESKEWIAGYDVLECADLDEALAVAANHPMARFGAIEVRPMWPFD